jgi:hypothetical protein
MKPEPRQEYLSVWLLAQIGAVNHSIPPYTVVTDSQVYMSLKDAQEAQTFQALRSSIKYEIFHLEFPL